jgi:FkbM family methyltransferase
MLVPGWLLARLWERRLSRVLAAALEGRAGTFVDVGAHVGEFLLKLRRIRPEVPYVGFEPNPEAYRVLARRAARLSGTRVRQVALGEREGVARLRFRRRGADPEASLVEGFRDASFYRSSIEVPVSTGDACLAAAGVDRVAMVKIDVEGAELEVLRGLRGTLARERPAILCELLPSFEGDTPLSLERIRRLQEVDRLLQGLEYRVGVVRRDGKLLSSPLRPHSDTARCDHLFAPVERWRALLARVGMEEEGEG